MLAKRMVIDIGTLVGAVALIIALFALDARFAPGVLLEPIDPAAWRWAYGAGLCAAGALFVVAVQRAAARGADLDGTKALNLAAAAVLVGVVLPAALLREGVQVSAFAGLAPPTQAQPFTVAGTHISWWSKHSNYYVDVLTPAGSTVALRASRSAFEAARSGDRIRLPVQVGRRGVRRVVAPDPLTRADLQAG